jgi:hypothetical protein
MYSYIVILLVFIIDFVAFSGYGLIEEFEGTIKTFFIVCFVNGW